MTHAKREQPYFLHSSWHLPARRASDLQTGLEHDLQFANPRRIQIRYGRTKKLLTKLQRILEATLLDMFYLMT